MRLVDPNLVTTPSESRSHQILENIYHKGQERAWDGREVLEMLLDKHGGISSIDEMQSRSIQRIFAVILWGELAAWKISLQLADKLKDIEAKMAATSQAHDEARHFYVMRDYLNLSGSIPRDIPRPVEKALNMVLTTNSLPKKLLGMQLMVEPIALTIFQEVRRIQAEPVLSDLLEYFERDEARHVALGVHYLPSVIKGMSTVKITSLITWQLRLFMLELKGLKDLSPDFKNLGLDPEQLFSLAEAKQLDALQKFVEELGLSRNVWEPIRWIVRHKKRKMFE